MGAQIAGQWRDAESFADVFSAYYTDAEPESAQVVERDGEVGGYLLGCIDSGRAWSQARVVAAHIVRRGIAFRPGTAGMVWRMARDAALDTLRRERLRDFDDPRYPAHFHIDLLPAFRGQGVGRELAQRFLDDVQSRRVPGCHVRTFVENEPAVAFFRAQGFVPSGRPVPTPGLRAPDGSRLHAQIFVRDLPAARDAD